MADDNQIAIISQGVEAWNKWREENPNVLIDLRSAKLRHMNLENANLADADLKKANLSSVTFDQKIMWKLGSDSFDTQHLRFNFLTMFYYSVVTFTTLGFGDIIPKTSTAALCVTVEVIIGYVMLGGLITIFASKLSRRGG